MDDTQTTARTPDAAGEDGAADIATPPGEASAAPRQRLARRADLAQRLEARPDEGGDAKELPRAADAWLERRLRVFERQMTAMESRQEQVEKNARAVVAGAEDAIKALQATVKALEDRADRAETKAKAAANEVRTALNEAGLRIQTVEGVARAALAESKPDMVPSEAPVAAAAMPVAPSMAEADRGGVPATDEPATNEPATNEPNIDAPKTDAPAPARSYLDDVRKSAAAAAAAAQAAEIAKKPKGMGRLTRYLLGSLAVFVFFAAGAGVAFSKGVSDGRRDVMAHVHSLPRTAMADPAPTPLDRLSMRAEAGDVEAQFAVGLRYLDGPQKNPQAALRWIARAASRGQSTAQYRLATLYAAGMGTTLDRARALQWYEASALQGNRKAMHALAIAYAQGQGTPKNLPEAARWFSRAADLGYVDSEFDLAVLYERGDGVPQSLLDAYKWYAVAGRQGDLESRQRVEALKTQLAPDDLAAADRAARAFRAAPYDVAANTR